ncbi:MAG: thioredoxin domain-containing protein [Sphingomonadaceae bacterium]
MKSVALVFVPVLMLAACGQTEGNSAAPAAKVDAIAPPAGTEWTTTVTKTADGGFLMGNPAAPIKLVEYASMSCSHCADFAVQASDTIDKMVATGRLSYEFRNYVRDPLDLTATLLARCGGAGPFFPLSKAMFADQANWFPKMQAISEAEQKALQTMPLAQQFARFAELIELDEFVRQRGISADKVKACLSDQAEADMLVKMRDRANTDYNLQGTPTFLINGKVVPDTANWEQLQPKLKAAGA